MSNLAVIGGWFILRRLCSSHVDVGQFKIFWVWYGSCCCPTNHSIYMYAQLTSPNQPCFLTSELIDALTMCVNLRTQFRFNIYIFDLRKMTWCTLASPKWNFKQLLPSGKDLLHNELHSTSRITLLIFRWVNPLLPKWICVHRARAH